MKCHVSVVRMDMSPVISMSPTQKGALTVLLALVDRTVTNTSLCNNTLYILSQVSCYMLPHFILFTLKSVCIS